MVRKNSKGLELLDGQGAMIPDDNEYDSGSGSYDHIFNDDENNGTKYDSDENIDNNNYVYVYIDYDSNIFKYDECHTST